MIEKDIRQVMGIAGVLFREGEKDSKKFSKDLAKPRKDTGVKNIPASRIRHIRKGR